MQKKRIALAGLIVSLGACTTTQPTTNNDTAELQKKLQQQEQTLSSRQMEIDNLSDELKQQRKSQEMASAQMGDPLLPPGAKAGECYARVWVTPQYRTVTDSYIATEASEKVTVQPAVYEWGTERVLAKESSEKLIAVPAQYGYEDETIKTSEEQRVWRTRLHNHAPHAQKSILDAADHGGINLPSAAVNSCYHEHYVQPEYETVLERVLVSEASETVSANAPTYETVEQRILVKEASTRLVNIAAVYENVSKQVIDKPAHTIWKKGTGPIQRIDAATGEIMCLVEIAATYKTVNQRVLKSAATTQSVEVPAEYKTIKVRRKVRDGEEERQTIAAKYQEVAKRVESKPGQFVWHEVHDLSLSKESRTGQQICLTETAATYKTVKRKVVTQAATFRTETIPAQYSDVRVRKLVSAAKETRTAIPEIEKTVSRQELVANGHMEWRSILCETNMTGDRLRLIQAALKDRGYQPGAIDGVIGQNTMAAVNAFQKDQELPVDRYLNIATLKALGVSAK